MTVPEVRGPTTDRSDPTTTKALFRRGYFLNWDTTRPHPLAKVYAKELSFALQRLEPRGKQVLDVGCGPGRFAIAFASEGAAGVTATDISSQVLTRARRRSEEASVAGRITFCVGDAERLPYRTGTFEAVSCMQTFVHLPNPEQAAREMFRVCRHGGRFVATATNQDRSWAWRYPSAATAEFLFERLPDDLRARVLQLVSSSRLSKALRLNGGLSAPHRGFSMSAFRGLFSTAGFVVKEELAMGHPAVFFFISGRKP
jgi:ubiquinone/menaquinone biosynthesis C-methylase UbiE